MKKISNNKFPTFEGVYLYKNKIKIYEGTTNYSFELDGSITNIEDDFWLSTSFK